MSTNGKRIIWRRGGSIVCALLSLYFVASAIALHVEGMRTNHLDYRHHIPMFVVDSIVLVIIGGALLFAARRLWRVPGQSP